MSIPPFKIDGVTHLNGPLMQTRALEGLQKKKKKKITQSK